MFALVTEEDPEISSREEALHSYLQAHYPGCTRFPYWNRLGKVGLGTGIYLGNSFVLTVAHVGEGTFTAASGKVYYPVPGSAKLYPNPGGTLSELCIFKIKVDLRSRDLEHSPIPVSRLNPEHKIIVLGTGYSRSKMSVTWTDDGKTRWGINSFRSNGSKPLEFGKCRTNGFFAIFGDARRFDCQGAPGDSGGAGFQYNFARKRWELTTVMLASTAPPDVNRSLKGDKTFFAWLDPMNRQPVRINTPKFADKQRSGRNTYFMQGAVSQRDRAHR